MSSQRTLRACAVATVAVLITGGCSLAERADGTSSPTYYRELLSIALPDGGWDEVSFDAARHRVLVARSDSVTAVDIQHRSASQFAKAADGHAVMVLRGGRDLLITDGARNTVRILDAVTGEERARLTVGAEPDATLLEPTTGLALVMNASGGTISLIDPTTRKLAGQISVGGALESAATDGHGKVFVNIADAGVVAVIDMSSKTVTSRIRLDGCAEPSGIVYAAAANRFVSACANSVAAVIDPSGRLETLLPIGAGSDAVLYDAARGRIVIPAGRSGDLTILSATAAGVRPLGRVPTHEGARIGAIDPQSGRLYVPAADFDPPAHPGGWPVPRPGTVHLIVLDPVDGPR